MPTVFVWEYACAVGDSERLPESIRTEGRAMLSALLEDFGRVAGVRVVTLVGQGEEFDRLAAEADWTLVVAPETGGLLAERCRRVLRSGGRLLGPNPEAVERTTDKLTLAEHLAAGGVPTPRYYPLSGALWAPFPAVLKPRDGAGSQATFLVRTPGALPECLASARAEGWDGELILQPFVPGTAASAAVLVGDGVAVPLLPATQELSEGRFHYLGGCVPLPGELGSRAVELARRAVAAVSGLAGYVGVDLILGGDPRGDCVLEINPRLTTSYVGLRALARFNLAAAMLDVVAGRDPGPLDWHAGAVRFSPAGRIHRDPADC